MLRNSSLLLSAIVGCASPLRHPAEDYHSGPPAPRFAVDRRCEVVKPEAKEHCALAGNAVGGHVEVLDMYHLRVGLTLAQTVSGCGEIAFRTTLSAAGGIPRQVDASAGCQRECMPEGPGGGVCWDIPLREFGFDLEYAEPLPFFRRDGTSQAGEIPLRIVSARNEMQPVELVARTAAEPARYAEDAVPAPAGDLCEEFNRNQSQLSAEEHQRRYGCPPCPCACHNGQIVCAPCAACEGFSRAPGPVESPVPLAPGR